MRNFNEQQSLKPSTLRAVVFVLLVMLFPVEHAQSQSPPTGPAGGDLSGTYPNPVLAADRVRKTGDTMTGTLNITIPGIQYNNPASKLRLDTSTPGYGVKQYFSLTNSNSVEFTYAAITGSIGNGAAAAESGALRFFVANAGSLTEKAVLLNNGNFGIGTSSPTTTLDVSGQIRSSVGFKFPDGTVQTTAATGSAITAVNAGAGLTGGGTTGSLTLNVGAGTGLTVAADTVSVNYGSTAGTAVQGNTSITVSAGTGMSGGGPLTLGAGGSVTLTNTDRGSTLNIFKNVANAAGTTQFFAGSPNDALRFEGTGGTSVSFDVANKKVIISGSSSSGWTDDGATLRLTTATDNVGIGTSTPGSKLDVTGTIRSGNADTNVGNHPTYGTTYSAFWRQGVDYSLLTNGTHTYLNAPVSTGNIYFRSANADKLFLQGSTGNVGIGNTNPTEKLDIAGNIKVTGTGNITAAGTITGGTINAKYQDVAEWVESSQSLPAGTVVVLDHTKSNQVVASTEAYDTRVAGVISAQPGITLGESGDAKVLVATTGRVKIKVDATRAPIQVGDLLVTGDREGFAMKSLPVNIGGVQLHRPGTLVGKALEPLAKGTGEILVLLSLQ